MDELPARQADRDGAGRGAGCLRPAIWVAAWLVTAPFALSGCDPQPLAPGSQLIGCDRADERVSLTTDAHLDPACTYRGGFEIVRSDLTLDCRGARIRGEPASGSRGIAIVAPRDGDLADVTLRGCRVEGFLNGLRVTRTGFRDLAPGEEYRNGTRDIVIEQSWFQDSHGVGIFVDGYVSGVTIRDSVITRAGSAGIYLETGSRRNRVERNWILDNGFRENGPDGQRFEIDGVSLWFWGVGREGIAVDGSYENTIHANWLEGNSAGGIFLYKNCGEYPDRPSYFERRFPADDNRIVGNFFRGGRNGVWVGSRMGENTLAMECTDPSYLVGPLQRVVLDHAADNVVRGNVFQDVRHGIRIEDDGTVVEGNLFFADSPDHHAVLVGTPHRSEVLGRPVSGTAIHGNVSAIAGNASPYRWAHGHSGTGFAWNFAEGRIADFCEGEPVPRQPFLFVLAATLAGPGGTEPATTPDLTVPTLGVLPACP